MGGLLVALIVNAIALIVVVQLVPGIELDWQESPLTLIAVAAIFAVVNTFLRPIVNLLTLPIRLLTLGLVGIVINVALLLLVVYIAGQLDLPFTVAGWPRDAFGIDVLIAALIASVVMGVVSTVVSLAVRGMRLVVPGVSLPGN
jgi:putative membrane protein